MKVKDAAVRAVRTLIQGTIVALGVMIADLTVAGSFAGFKEAAPVFLFAECLAALAAVVSFLQNVIEDNTSAPAIK